MPPKIIPSKIILETSLCDENHLYEIILIHLMSNPALQKQENTSDRLYNLKKHSLKVKSQIFICLFTSLSSLP